MYYEVLRHPITEIEAKRQMSLYMSVYDDLLQNGNSTKEIQKIHVLVPPTMTVKNLLHLVSEQLQLPKGTILRMIETSSGGSMVNRILANTLTVDDFPPSVFGNTGVNGIMLFVEVIPIDELKIMGAKSVSADFPKLISVSSFAFQFPNQEWIQSHSIAFISYIHKDDTFRVFKERIRRR